MEIHLSENVTKFFLSRHTLSRLLNVDYVRLSPHANHRLNHVLVNSKVDLIQFLFDIALA